MKKGEMLGKMLVLVTNAHAGQYDRGGYPNPGTVWIQLPRN